MSKRLNMQKSVDKHKVIVYNNNRNRYIQIYTKNIQRIHKKGEVL